MPKDDAKQGKYNHLDALILARVQAGPALQFTQLMEGALREECLRLADANEGSRARYGDNPFSVLDRRLQALRKRGAIRFNGSGKGFGWVLVEDRTPSLELL